MKALRIYCGPKAMQHIAQNGLQPRDIGVVPGAAGGPKGLILGPLDRFIFGEWLAQTKHDVHLVGASIGAWRMATACLRDPVAGFKQLAHDYIGQDYAVKPGEKFPSADTVSEDFGHSLAGFYAGKVADVLGHPRYKLHIVTSRGRHILSREHKLATPLGYAGAFLTNAIHRKAMGSWLERVVFSSQNAALPFDARDYPTRQIDLSEANFNLALQASCSIPFVMRSVRDIPGAPRGAYWDGGITDYHLHLNYRLNCASDLIAVSAINTGATALNDNNFEHYSLPRESSCRAIPVMHNPALHQDRYGLQVKPAMPVNQATTQLVLYPHFQKAVVPGWLDKGLTWRHKATPFLSNMVLLAPNPDWVKTLPNAKLPDRTDFKRYGIDLQARVKAWSRAASSSQQLADELHAWLHRPDLSRVEAL